MKPDTALPPLKVVDAALRATTELLAAELARPSGAAPNWNAFQWSVAQAVAGMHGVSALLSDRLRWEGPQAWQRFLCDQHEHTLRRHRRIRALLADLDGAARAQGIALVALKGVELHALGLYREGERPMADVDLLAAAAAAQATAGLLHRLGYQETYTTRRERVFEPSGVASPAHFAEHADNPVKVELHVRISEHLPVRDVDITRTIFPGHRHPGLNRYRSAAALMTHLLLHAAGNLRARALRLLHLHDIALLATRLSGDDWEPVLQQDGRGAWWAFPALQLTARYYPDAIPRSVLERAQSACPWPLRLSCRQRMLSDVSLSSLWIRAFPGIEWSRSVTEALGYARARVFPGRDVRALRTVYAPRQLWASRGDWVKQSQARRMVQWLRSRTPRPESLSPVLAVVPAADAGGPQLDPT